MLNILHNRPNILQNLSNLLHNMPKINVLHINIIIINLL